ncbi:MAG: transcription antitermination factor NusB [Actinomycetota bacterium]|nr:transcription antitermination factor NusB [Actinomycetota bacterium]
MRERRAARRAAIDVLYEAEIRDELPLEALQNRRSEGWVVASGDEAATADEPGPSADVFAYAEMLVEGVQLHQAEIDALIARYADRWAITRMPVVDRTLLRIALFELLWRDDIPIPVAINEAVELAKELSTEDSGRFINGLLGKVVEAEGVRSR